jgi:hypothetical protein
MKEWISTSVVAKHFQVSRGSVKKIAEAAKIRRQVLPGMKGLVRYNASDVERVAREIIIGSKKTAKVES